MYELFMFTPKCLEAQLKYQFLNSSHKKDTTRRKKTGIDSFKIKEKKTYSNYNLNSELFLQVNIQICQISKLISTHCEHVHLLLLCLDKCQEFYLLYRLLPQNVAA